MAMKYVQKFGGYIADVPYMYFRRCDGTVFHFDQVTNATFNPDQETINVNAGWSTFQVATISGRSTLNMTISLAKFMPELFTLSSNANDEQDVSAEIYGIKDMDDVVVMIEGDKNKISAYKSDDIESVIRILQQSAFNPFSEKEQIQGLKSFDTVAYTADTKTLILANSDLYEEDDETVVINNVQLKATDTKHTMKIDLTQSAIGELLLVYPVYSDGQKCTESSIIGKVVLRVYKARFTKAPGFNASYKQAMTFDMELTGLDAKKPDGSVYSISYISAS